MLFLVRIGASPHNRLAERKCTCARSPGFFPLSPVTQSAIDTAPVRTK